MITLAKPTTAPQARRQTRLPMALLLSATLVAAAGGGSALLGASSAAASTASTDGSTITTSSAETTAFVEAANRICVAGAQQADAVPPPHHDHDVPAYLAQLRVIAHGIQDDLRAVPRPAADSELLVSRFLDPSADALSRAPQVQQQAAEAQTAEEIAAARQQVDALRAQAQAASSFALDYGLTECASPNS